MDGCAPQQPLASTNLLVNTVAVADRDTIHRNIEDGFRQKGLVSRWRFGIGE